MLVSGGGATGMYVRVAPVPGANNSFRPSWKQLFRTRRG